MKKLKQLHGYTIYSVSEKDKKNGECLSDFAIYFSSDIKDYGRRFSEIEYETDSLKDAESFCLNDNEFALIREELEEECTAVSYEDIEEEQKKRQNRATGLLEIIPTGTSYAINNKDLNTIKGIEAINYEEAQALQKALNGELIAIKCHHVFILEIGGYFGLSALVFRDKMHLYHADEFELHYKYKPHATLRDFYIKKMQSKLFNDADIAMCPVTSYEDYKAKEEYLRNYWIMRYNRISAFFIEGSEEEKRYNELSPLYPYFDNVSFCRVQKSEIVDFHRYLLVSLNAKFQEMRNTTEGFRTMIRYELYNFEYMYSHNITEPLHSLGLSVNILSDEQKKIVFEECANIDSKVW